MIKQIDPLHENTIVLQAYNQAFPRAGGLNQTSILTKLLYSSPDARSVSFFEDP